MHNISRFCYFNPNPTIPGMKIISTIALAVMLAVPALAQTGKVLDNLSLPSKLLKSERKFAVYLPPDYATSERSYPVMYLLHGAGDDHTGWVQFGEVLHIADKAISEGTATPMIIIMPDAPNDVRCKCRVKEWLWPSSCSE